MNKTQLSTSERQQAEARFKEIIAKYRSKSYGKMWKKNTPIEIKIENEKLVALLTK